MEEIIQAQKATHLNSAFGMQDWTRLWKSDLNMNEFDCIKFNALLQIGVPIGLD